MKDALGQRESRRREAVEHYLRAKLYAQESEFEAAVREFKKAVELDPTDGALRREYGELLRDLPVYPGGREGGPQGRRALPEQRGSASAPRPGAPRDREGQGRPRRGRLRAEGGERARARPTRRGPSRTRRSSSASRSRRRRLRFSKDVLDRANGPAVLLLYGETLERSGQLPQAEEVYKSLLKLDPENRAALLGLLRVYDRGRQFDKAAPILQGFLKQQPGNLGLKTQYAGLLLRGRRFAEARKIVEEVLAGDPGNREALRLYAALLSETREPDKADEALRKLQALEPDDLEIPYRRAMNFLEARRIPEAEGVLRELRASLVAKKPDGPEIAQIDGQLGYAAYLRKDYAAATARLEPHLRGEDGLNLQAYNLLLQIARDREDWVEGLRLAKDAYDKAPKKTPMLRSNYAEFRLRSSSAAEQAEGATMLDTLAAEDRAGTLMAADAWQRLDKFGRAAAAARAGLERDREDPDLLFRLAASLEREKKVSESVDAFEKLLKVRGDHAPGLNYLGYMWADRGENLPRALELIRKAVELEPGQRRVPRFARLGLLPAQQARQGRGEPPGRGGPQSRRRDGRGAPRGPLREEGRRFGRAAESWKRALTLKPDEDVKRRLDDKLQKTDAKEVKRTRSRFAAGCRMGSRLVVFSLRRWMRQRARRVRGASRAAASPSSSRRSSLDATNGCAPRAWDPSRRFKALFKAEVSPKVGAIGRGLSVRLVGRRDGHAHLARVRADCGSGKRGISEKGRSGGRRLTVSAGEISPPGTRSPTSSPASSVRRTPLPALSPFEETREACGCASMLEAHRPAGPRGRSIEISFRTARPCRSSPGKACRAASRRRAPTGGPSSPSRPIRSWPEGEEVPPACVTEELALESFAKVNRSLRVLGKRPDGYHEIDTIFQTVDLTDEINFFERDDDGIALTIEGVGSAGRPKRTWCSERRARCSRGPA